MNEYYVIALPVCVPAWTYPISVVAEWLGALRSGQALLSVL